MTRRAGRVTCCSGMSTTASPAAPGAPTTTPYVHCTRDHFSTWRPTNVVASGCEQEHAIRRAMELTPNLKVTLPYHADEALIEKALGGVQQ